MAHREGYKYFNRSQLGWRHAGMPRRCLLPVHELSLHALEVKTTFSAQNLDDATGLSRFAGPGGCVSRSF